MGDEDDLCQASSGFLILGVALSWIRQRKYPSAEDAQQAISNCNGLRQGRYHSDKQALQIALVRLELRKEDTILYKRLD